MARMADSNLLDMWEQARRGSHILPRGRRMLFRKCVCGAPMYRFSAYYQDSRGRIYQADDSLGCLACGRHISPHEYGPCTI